MPSVTRGGYDGSDSGLPIRDKRHRDSKLNLHMLLKIKRNGGKMINTVKEFFWRNFFKNSFIGYGQMRTILF